MILLLHGPDSYRARERLRFYQNGFKKKYDPSGFNVIRLDGETLTMEEFTKHVGQMGFLAEKRFIVIENLISKNKSKKIQEEIIVYLDSQWSDENVLLFLEESAAIKARAKKKTRKTASKPLLARLQKEKVEEFDLLTGASLYKWVRQEVKKRGGSISDQAVSQLAQLVGSDLWQMSSEIDKLLHYKAKGMIMPKDVALLVRAKYDENIFHLTDALAAQDARRSFQLLSEQLAAGNHELYILTMLVRQFRILLQVREIINTEQNYYTVASRLHLHPFVAQKAVTSVKQFTSEELQDIYRSLMEIDTKIKSTSQNPQLLFDLLIAKVCKVG